MLNKDIYHKLPELNRLANNGVAEVSEDRSDAALQVLRYELETFVCDGQYEKGLEDILEGFLRNLSNKNEQPGVWISGFYGSGKSHLAKMLRNLWTDTVFADGISARHLAKLPATIADSLKELSVRGKQAGGLHAAAGKLGAGAGDMVRLALMSIIFKSRDLPEQFAQAQFVMFLRQEGIEAAVSQHLQAAGRSLTQELPHLYVSSHLAKAVMAAKPDFADSDMAARQFIKANFPQKIDISNDEMIRAIHDALEVDGKFPLTLIVLDEVQQYIGNDAQKAYQVQEVTETLSKHFKGSVLFAATGQSALSGVPNLMRLMGRFPVKIMLGDWDVENVTRKIILGKKPTALPAVDQVWKDNLGEISRHLRGTKLEHVTDDEMVMTADYPILPVRRRFWERVLRTIDATGTVSQLRSQLRVVHEAVMATADLPLGHVVSGDFLYDQIAADLVSTAQLPKEIYEQVQRFAAEGELGELKSRVLKLIYLINKLPPEAAVDLGIRATLDVLADLLVMDLKQGSTELRKQLPGVLDALQGQDRLVMSLESGQGTEYRLQTRESSTWYDEFRTQEASLKSAPQQVEMQRSELFKERIRQVVSRVRVTQGKSHEARSLSLIFDEALPKAHAQALTIWVQDGWQTDERSLLTEARAQGADCPTVFMFIPGLDKTPLTNALITLKAAAATISRRGTPSTEEGRDAQRSMESRLRNAEKEVEALMSRLLAATQVFQAGGQEIQDGIELADKLNKAAKASVVRLYRDFDVADSEAWPKVLSEAQKGNTEALKAIGHTVEPERHPVCQKVLSFIGGGKRGSDIRDQFTSAPFGWSRDVVDACLYALLATGHLKATDATARAVDAKSLDRAKLTQAFFEQESVTLSTVQKLKLRGLFSKMGVPCQANEELTKAPVLLMKIKSEVQRVSQPAPAPAPPDTTLLQQLEGLTGNALLLAMVTAHDSLLALQTQCASTEAKILARQPHWSQLNALLSHATDLGPYAELKAERDSVLSQRTLLAEPNPITPLTDRVAAMLRSALQAKLQEYQLAAQSLLGDLAANEQWQKLGAEQQKALLKKHQAEALPAPKLASHDDLADALDDCDLSRWGERTQALKGRLSDLLFEAAQLTQPKVARVMLSKRTLETEADLRVWLAETEKSLLAHIKNGPVMPS